jgi:uracil-DNA glycosylase family 4
LFVGDAPDAESSICKIPFVGTTGQLLDSIIEEALSPDISFIITYAMLCPPYEDASRSSLRQPLLPEVTACQHNLQYLISHSQPRAVVALGKVAKNSLKKLYPSFTEILAPIAIQASTHHDYEREKAILILKGIEECLRKDQ